VITQPTLHTGDAATSLAMDNPQVGDRFTEHYCFWMYVLESNGGSVTTIEASSPCEFPKDGEIKKQSYSDFKKRFSYESIPGYWVRLVDRNNDVSGWM
jgi:hypothetical protein